MCLGIPGRIVELPLDRPAIARVDVGGVVRDINLLLIDEDPPAIGEWVLIHLGFALQKMTEAEVAEVRSTRDFLGWGGGGAFVDPVKDDAPSPAPIGEPAS